MAEEARLEIAMNKIKAYRQFLIDSRKRVNHQCSGCEGVCRDACNNSVTATSCTYKWCLEKLDALFPSIVTENITGEKVKR